MPHSTSTQAHVTGGRAGHGETSDGLLSVDLAMPKELGGQGGATNPEQLFAIGYAACFESAIRFIARKQKLPLHGCRGDLECQPASQWRGLQARRCARGGNKRS